MFADQSDAFVIDSTYQTIKYYAIITAIQAEDHHRALALIERAANEPFIENTAYKESDLYELMASEYHNLGDSVNYVEALVNRAEHPTSNYFVTNLVNAYIRRRYGRCARNTDQAIVNEPFERQTNSAREHNTKPRL